MSKGTAQLRLIRTRSGYPAANLRDAWRHAGVVAPPAVSWLMETR